ncbi:MAG: hypothetical protein RLZ35_409 [Pseudomonadota bacterium]|jgi:peptidoglycan/xylan/chitin deacetylase (PgdA/CDA1 family)
MLLIGMYHKISDPSDPKRLLAFKQHLIELKRRFSIVTPADRLPKHQVSVCLTFDDAYYDFYHYVYPLLQALDLKAVLAIPTAYITEHTQIPAEERLAVPYPNALSDYSTVKNSIPFCTWSEIREMVDSQRVYPASHSHNHLNLCEKNTNIREELDISKQLLEEKLNMAIDTFVYPYGKMNRMVHKTVQKTYRFGLRIGGAINLGWSTQNGLLYRVNADPFWIDGKKISSGFLVKSVFNHALNRLRGK